MHNLHTTDELIAAYQADEGPDPSWYHEAIAVVIPVAIDAVYQARNEGLSMHGAGAAAGIAALEALTSSRVMQP